MVIGGQLPMMDSDRQKLTSFNLFWPSKLYIVAYLVRNTFLSRSSVFGLHRLLREISDFLAA